MWRGFRERWIDVYENDGKRSGAYSAPVYGVHPYMLHELGGHARRRVHAGARDGPLDAHDAVARAAAVRVLGLHDLRRRSAVDAVARRCCSSTCSRRATDRDERIVLLQHAIDNITSTFYTQVLFADFELAAHERVERDEPITADVAERALQGAVRRLLRRLGGHGGR